MTDFLIDMLRPQRLTHIVDIGANPIDGPAPYQELLQKQLCQVTGFEPQREAFKELNAKKTGSETYLPYAIGDGSEANFHICAYPGFSSLLKPCARALAVFPEFTANAHILDVEKIQTHRLDDIPELSAFDFLKIDVQGSELNVFRNAKKHLENVVVIQLEMSFVPLYENQPALGSVDSFLRDAGFLPHCFAAVKHWKFGPVVTPGHQYKQLLEADMVYVKNLISPLLSSEQLKQMAIVLHHVYQSYDAVGYCISLLQNRGVLGVSSLGDYVRHLNDQLHSVK